MIDPISKIILSRVNHNQNYGPLILMYHSTVLGNVKQDFIYSIDSNRLCRQLDLLKKMGWYTACIKDLKMVEQLPKKTVIITFDDGFANNYEGAYLPLVKRGMCATWFITSGCIGSYSTWLDDQNNEKMLTAEQLREMSSEGMEIGSHTITHLDLTTLPIVEIEKEIMQSKIKIENIIDDHVRSFASPYGRYNHSIIECIKKSGYSFACSVRPGWYSSMVSQYELPRITIFAGDSLGTFARKLAFASNDVSWNQTIKYYQDRLVARF
ncbi:MAG: polysaccharide deacetylase family protein [Desulfobacula sp.]|jgi:peptidoglycan/xylan/chitin deacetylase (PgdA/CDA1 family)|nr:polysaccharide deacetylase family protein [Desulfobacula sp.]